MDLTRRQVAAKLRKSVATVRRLEGHVLHPRRDSRGVYRFNSDEVERVCIDSHCASRWSRSAWLRRRAGAGKAPPRRRTSAEVDHAEHFSEQEITTLLAAAQLVALSA